MFQKSLQSGALLLAGAGIGLGAKYAFEEFKSPQVDPVESRVQVEAGQHDYMQVVDEWLKATVGKDLTEARQDLIFEFGVLGLAGLALSGVIGGAIKRGFSHYRQEQVLQSTLHRQNRLDISIHPDPSLHGLQLVFERLGEIPLIKIFEDPGLQEHFRQCDNYPIAVENSGGKLVNVGLLQPMEANSEQLAKVVKALALDIRGFFSEKFASDTIRKVLAPDQYEERTILFGLRKGKSRGQNDFNVSRLFGVDANVLFRLADCMDSDGLKYQEAGKSRGKTVVYPKSLRDKIESVFTEPEYQIDRLHNLIQMADVLQKAGVSQSSLDTYLGKHNSHILVPDVGCVVGVSLPVVKTNIDSITQNRLLQEIASRVDSWKQSDLSREAILEQLDSILNLTH